MTPSVLLGEEGMATIAARREFPPRAVEGGGVQDPGVKNGTRLPPGAVVSPLELRPFCLEKLDHGHPSGGYTSTCYVADCEQAV